MSETLEFAYRRRYNLPPTDPRFLDATEADMLVDHWAHRHWDDPKLRDEVVTDDFENELAQMEAEALAKDAEYERRMAAEAAAKPADDWEVVAEDRFT